MSGSELKQNLLYYLKRICSFSHVVEFCDLLMSGQSVVENFKNRDLEDSYLMTDLLEESDEVFEELKEVSAVASVEVLIKKLSEILCVDIKPTDENTLQSLLLKTDSCNSLEYLEGLVNFFDQFIQLYWNVEQFYSSVYVKDITKFKLFVRRDAFNHAMDILSIFFQICKDKVEVSEEEKHEWRCLFLVAADDIKFSIKCGEGLVFSRLPFTLKVRSCIECILDLFAECPEKYADASKELDKIIECKEFFDYLIDNLSEHPYCDSDTSDYSECDTTNESDLGDGQKCLPLITR